MKKSDQQAFRFKKLLEQMESIRASKNADYASDDDAMSNFRGCEQMGIPAWKGVVIRISDKFSRIIQLSKKDAQAEVKDEAITDTLLDMANYCLLTIMLFEEWSVDKEWKKQNK